MNARLSFPWFVCILIVAFAHGPALAADKCGAVCDETWDLAGSPYVVTCDVTVAQACALDIDAAVMVRFQSGTGIIIDGNLTIAGLTGSPVVLTSDAATPARGNWDAVELRSGAVGSINGAEISYAVRGVQGTDASVVIDDSRISQSSTAGVQASGGTLDLTNTTLTDNSTYGVYATGAVAFTVEAVEASGGTYGMFVDGASTGTVTNYTAQANGTGLYASASSVGTTSVGVSASSFTGNNYGVWAQGVNSPAWTNPDVVVSASSLLDNTSFNYYATGFYEPADAVVPAGGNWWGTTDASAIASKIYDRKNAVGSPTIDWCAYLDAPAPGGVRAHNDLCPDLLACDATVAWNATDQIYLLTSTMTVCPTGTLDLGPGIEVRAVSATIAINVEGILNINGTEGTPVTLTSEADTPARGDWTGLRFVAGSSGSINGAEISYAVRGVQGTDASVVIDDSRISQSSTAGVQASGGTLDLTNTTLTDNSTYGVYATGAVAFTVEAVEASGGTYGMFVDGASTGTVTNYTAQANGTGLYASASSVGTTSVGVSASSFTGNNYGVWAQGVNSPAWTNPDVVVSASSLLDNTSFNYYATGFYEPADAVVPAGGNWWGTTDASAIASKIYDRKNAVGSPTIDWCAYLDAPAPGGVRAHNDLCPDLLACDATVAWNATDQIYLLTSTMTVCPTGTLDLGPGIEVRAVSATIAINVEGILNINGTEGTPVTLTSEADTPARGDWTGLRFVAGSSGSINGAEISYAVRGVQGTDASVVIDDSRISQSSTAGVQASGGTLDLTNTTLTDNSTYGVYATGAVAFTVEAVEASGGTYGMFVDGASTGTVTNYTAQANGTGLYASASSVGTTSVGVSASSFTGNNYGVWAQGVNSPAWTNPDVVVSASSLLDNTSFNYYATGFYEPADAVVPAGGNWWGTTDASAIASKIYDRKNAVGSPTIDWCAYLDAPAPGGVRAHNDLCPDLLACDATVAWNATDQIYLLTSTMTVCPTGTLDLGPGIEVRAVSATIAINVEGILNINGTEGTPVTLTSEADTPARGDWTGLRFVAGSSGSINGAEISYAVRGVQGTDASVVIDDSRISQSSTAGVQASGGTLDLTNTTLTDNSTYGVYATGAVAFTVEAVEASGGTYGMFVDGASTGTVTNYTAQANGTGLYASASSVGTTSVGVSASSFTGNNYGVWAQGVNSPAWTNPDVVVSASSLLDNTSFNYYATGFYEPADAVVPAGGNWWGTTDASAIASKIYDRKNAVGSPTIDWCAYLDAPAPGGVRAHNDLCPDLLACDATVAWNATDQIYLLTSTMTVCPTGTLDLGPGIEVRAVSATIAINVEGILNINGTEGTPVTLTSEADTPARGDWTGLRFVAGSSGSINGAEISYAVRGVQGTDASVVIDDSRISQSSTAGVQASGGTLDLTNTTLTDNSTYGVYATGAVAFTVEAVEASGGTYGMFVDGASTGTVTNYTAQANGTGLYASASSVGTTSVGVSASSFTGNNYGVWAQGVNSPAWTNPDVVVSASSLRDNTSFNYYATGFYQAADAVLWAPDCWWGTTDAELIAATIFDRDDSPAGPRVVTRAFGSSCEAAIGRNSDSDSLGDFEDNCPAASNSNQADADSDGMGDACDPEPATAPFSQCNGIDDITDGFADADGDGWGDPCDFQPLRADSYPGAPEICDGRDNNGDASFAEGELTDDDEDGAVACLDGAGDCNDAEPDVFPCACERCANLVDDDCNDATDGADGSCTENPYCILVTPDSAPLVLNLNKGDCLGATSGGPYDVIRGFTTNLGLAGGSVDLGNVACTSGSLPWDRVTDVSEDANPVCNDGSVFWLARPTGAADYGASSAGQPRDVSNPDPVCP